MKRPMHRAPSAVDACAPVITNPIGAGIKLDAKAMHDMSQMLLPSGEEFSTMISFILSQKRKPMAWLAGIVGVNGNVLSRIVKLNEQPKGPLARCIWLIYAFNRNPAWLADDKTVALWGRQEVIIPKRAKNSSKLVEAFIAEHHLKTNRRLKTLDIVNGLMEQGHFVDRRVVGNICRRIKYKFKRGHKVTMAILRPCSIWMSVNWARPNKDIAAAIGIGHTTVSANRGKLKRLPRETLIAAFTAAGRDLKAVEDLLRK